MRKLVAPVLSTFLMVAAVGLLSGCTARASIGGGADNPPPPPPPAKTEEPAPPPPPAQPELKVENGKLSLPGAIVFKTGKAEIDEVSFPVLDLVKAYLDAKPQITKLRVEGPYGQRW
jgi:outer membrane protein OmpA-like peptidoglycan-associated protein